MIHGVYSCISVCHAKSNMQAAEHVCISQCHKKENTLCIHAMYTHLQGLALVSVTLEQNVYQAVCLTHKTSCGCTFLTLNLLFSST